MNLNSKVKDYLFVETRKLIKFNDFDEIYYALEQIIAYDVASYAIEGISERMIDALNKIAVEKIDRDDTIFCFSTILNCFEPYVKKVLYLIDKAKYDELRKKENASLPDYLAALELKVFRDKKDRTDRSDKIYLAYKLRNINSHECRKWSFLEIYENLQILLCSYLIVVEKKLVELKNVFGGLGVCIKYESFNIDSFKKMRPEDMIKFIRLGIYNMDPMVRSLKFGSGSVKSISFFDREGLCVDDTYEAKNYHVKTLYSYQEKDNIYRTDISSTVNADGFITDEREGYWTYRYNSQGKIEEAIYYEFKNGIETRKKAILFSYFSDGGIQIIEGKYTTQSNIDMIRLFNNTGRLASIESNGHRTVFKYENDQLSMIIGTSVIVDVKRIGNEQFFIEKENNKQEAVLKQKRLYNDNNLLIRVEWYRKEKESNKLSLAWDIEYHDGIN